MTSGHTNTPTIPDAKPELADSTDSSFATTNARVVQAIASPAHIIDDSLPEHPGVVDGEKPTVCMKGSKGRYAVPRPDEVSMLARIGAKWSVIMLAVRQIIGIVTTAIIARLVSPDHFGLVAMVTTLTSFLMLLDTGLAWATVRQKDIDQEQIDTLFWLGAFWGVALCLISILLAPVAATFFGRREVLNISIALGVGLLLNSLTTQPAALVKRQIRQKTFSGVETLSVLLAGMVGISMAFCRLGYWAIVAQSLVYVAFRFILLFYCSGYRPGPLKLSFRALGMLQIGGYLGLGNFVTYPQLFLDNILIGHYGGAAQLGFYSKAFFLRTLPTMYAANATTDVMIPALSALAGDPENLATAYRKAVGFISFLGCPVAAFLGVAAPEVVHLLYGPAWSPVVPLLICLSFPATVLPIYTTNEWLFIATGKGREKLWLSLAVTPVVIAAFLLAIRHGALGIAIAAAIVFTIPIPLVSLYTAHRVAGISFRKTLQLVLPILGACLVAVLAAAGAGQLAAVGQLPWLVLLVVKAISGLSVYLAMTTWLLQPLPVPFFERLVSRTFPSRRRVQVYTPTCGQDRSSAGVTDGASRILSDAP